MTNATLVADPWIEYFKEDGTAQSRLLLAVYGIRSLFASVGIIFNISIVHITWVNKSFHNVCNILIAAESSMAIVMDAGFYFLFLLFASGIKFIPHRICFPIMLPACLLGNCAQMAMVLTGFDRLLCIVAPIWYKYRNRWRWLLYASIVIIVYALYWCVVYYFDNEHIDQRTLVSCAPHELIRGDLGAMMNVTGMMLSGVLMATYTLIFIMAFVFHPIAKKIEQDNKRLIKSLVFIIGVNMFGVFIRTAMSYVFSTLWKVDSFVKNPYNILMSFVTIAVYSINAPALYIINENYRNKFNKHYPWLRRLFGQTNNVQQHAFTSSVIVHPAAAHRTPL